MVKKLVAVNIKLYRKCARCGKEETPEEITRELNELVYVNDTDIRIEIEPLYLNEEKIRTVDCVETFKEVKK